jgi:hypothetical protein
MRVDNSRAVMEVKGAARARYFLPLQRFGPRRGVAFVVVRSGSSRRASAGGGLRHGSMQ